MRFPDAILVPAGLLALCGALAWTAASLAAGSPLPGEGPGALPWRVAGRAGFTVDAAAFPDSAGLSLELYIRIPPATLRTLSVDTAATGRVHIEAELRSGYGSRRHQVQQDITISPADTLGAFGEVVLFRLPALPGPQKLKVRVEDVNSRKSGLAYLGRTAHEVATVSGEFELSAAQQGRQLSDPEFVWEEQEARPSSAAFQRDGRSLIPNPERLYGLFANELHVAFSGQGPDAARPWHWRVRVLDERQAAAASAESTADAAPRFAASARLDVSRLPAGGYDLELTAWRDGDAQPLKRVTRFSVAWQPEAWRRSVGEMQDLVHFLFKADDEERFARLQPGEQERWLEDYWRHRDPTPDTAVNEAREAFMQRVAVANQRFSRAGFGPGMFSDMGRVFIRYGEPSEIEKQVMPAGDETLRQIVEDLTFSENRDIGGVRSQGLGGDTRPYEVWIFEGDIPAPLDVDPTVDRAPRRKRLLFLFVDDHGLGDYRLRYSNE